VSDVYYPVGARLRHCCGSVWVVQVQDEGTGDYTATCVVGTERPGRIGGGKEGSTQVFHAEYLENPSSWYRECACGCGRLLEGMRPNAIYASRACNTRAWKGREGIVGYRAVKRSRRPKKSGLQVSYRKAVLALALDYQCKGSSWRSAIARAERVLGEALSDRQRTLLHAREERKRAA
jgi:hypothetical protein